MTGSEAKVVRRLLMAAKWPDTVDADRRTIAIAARLLRSFQPIVPQGHKLARVWIVESEHKEVPGRQVSVFEAQADAERHQGRMQDRYPGALEYCECDEHPVEPTTCPE